MVARSLQFRNVCQACHYLLFYTNYTVRNACNAIRHTKINFFSLASSACESNVQFYKKYLLL